MSSSVTGAAGSPLGPGAGGHREKPEAQTRTLVQARWHLALGLPASRTVRSAFPLFTSCPSVAFRHGTPKGRKQLSIAGTRQHGGNAPQNLERALRLLSGVSL